MGENMKKLKSICSFLLILISGTSSMLFAKGTESKIEDKTFNEADFEVMNALKFTKVMGNGINLGNTMEAAGAYWLGYNAKPEQYETSWGQPVTTKKIFEAMKDAGFDSVRIPVAWTSTMDWRNGDFKINDDFMDRVKTLVDWALDAGLIVMINDHWDYQWWGLFGQDKTLAYKIFDAIWDDVGTNFKDYSYKLVFDAGNEEWGHRFNDEVDGKTGNLTVAAQYKLMTELSQYFVDKIRKQGSKNSKRFLLIPGYNTDFVKTTDSQFKMPADPSNNISKLMVSVHYYSPALYSLVGEPVDWGGIKQPAKTWGSVKEISEQNRLFNLLKNFKNDGIGVVIGEYAVAMLKNKDGSYSRKENDVLWLENVLDNCDRNNYAPFLWDCNNYFHKTGKLGFTDSDIAELYKSRRYELEN